MINDAIEDLRPILAIDLLDMDPDTRGRVFYGMLRIAALSITRDYVAYLRLTCGEWLNYVPKEC